MATEIVHDCTTGEITEREMEPLSLEQRQADLARQIDRRRDATFHSGFTPTAGPLSGKTLQTRDIEDRTNWLTSQAAYAAAVAAGAGALEEAVFRTADNETVTCTYLAGLQTLLAMAAWGKAVMGNSWTLKDAVAAAESDEDLDAIDVEAGWP